MIYPPQASVLSAFGTLVTPVRLDLGAQRSGRAIGDLDWARIDRILDELAREAGAALQEAGCAPASVTLIFAADLRYLGQQSELTIALDADPRSHHDAEPDRARVRGDLQEALRRQSVPCPDRAGRPGASPHVVRSSHSIGR